MHILTKDDLRGPPCYGRPHVLLLGAGASKAAFLNGDGNGRRVPLMTELPDIIGRPWQQLLAAADPPNVGFESQFTWLKNQQIYNDDLENIEDIISSYFLEFVLPDHATVYDYIVLGLQPKDVIATFNWDPFLMLAHRRNRDVSGLALPDIRFLHGSVYYSSCLTHDIVGCPGEQCPICNILLADSQLIFPIEEKNYGEDTLISRDWKIVTDKLTNAFHLTIFGYSGPRTDHRAKQLLRDAWHGSAGSPENPSSIRHLSHVEIIDIATPNQLERNWQDFIPFGHSMLYETFWDSTIARWPRRTAEYKLAASIYGMPSEHLGPRRTQCLRELQDFHAEIAQTEPYYNS